MVRRRSPQTPRPCTNVGLKDPPLQDKDGRLKPAATKSVEKRHSGERRSGGLGGRILLLPCSGNILYFRFEAGRTMSGLQAHFFVGAGWSALRTGYGRGGSTWIWKKSAALPSGWRVRKAWKSLMSNGKSASSGSCGCTSIEFRSRRRR